MYGTIVLIVIAIVVIAYVLKGIKIISQSETMIIERLGRYHRTLNAGINVILPIVERGKETATRRGDGRIVMNSKIDLREQVFDFDKQSVITKDNVMTEINALLYFQIVDPVKSVYEIQNLPMAIEKLTQTTLRNVVGELELDETLTSRDKAEGEKQSAILKSEGEKSAEINAAEAEKQARILRAEGQAQAQILQAEAEAEAIRKVTDSVAAVKGADPVNYLLAIKYIDGLKEMAQGNDSKTVYIPYEATGVLGSLGTLKEMFKNS